LDPRRDARSFATWWPGASRLPRSSVPTYAAIVDLEGRYGDLEPGLADCAIVVLAERHRTTRILSFDERHFRAVSPRHGDAFTILPADA
jgi:predicted nucleic acid-binding protein